MLKQATHEIAATLAEPSSHQEDHWGIFKPAACFDPKEELVCSYHWSHPQAQTAPPPFQVSYPLQDVASDVSCKRPQLDH